MNDAAVQLNDRGNRERQTQTHERSFATGGPAHISDRTWTAASMPRWLTPMILVAFWALHYSIYTVFSLLNSPRQTVGGLMPRAIVSLIAIAISFGIVAILRSVRHCRLGLRALTAVVLTVIATALHTISAEQVFAWFFPGEQPTSPVWFMYTTDYLNRVWWFAALCSIILALSYVADIREREERIGALQALAHDAQLRALRNQLNPHFLFNALNSIAGLISRRRGQEAESMTENLADFLRVTLALDPEKLITLIEETKLQQLYLDIEKVRFPDRLTVKVELPTELEQVLVPSLITQPLIENSIKYAVARSSEPVELRIRATIAANDALSLVVEDSGGNAAESPSKSAHLGIANVTERLKAHYGDAARLEVGPKETGGFRNTILLPIRRS